MRAWQWMIVAAFGAVLAAALPTFATAVQRVSPAPPSDAGAGAGADADAGASTGPDLMSDPQGNGLLVTNCDGAAATARFWEGLLRTSVPRP